MNSMTYGTWKFNAEFTWALQKSQSLNKSNFFKLTLFSIFILILPSYLCLGLPGSLFHIGFGRNYTRNKKQKLVSQRNPQQSRNHYWKMQLTVNRNKTNWIFKIVSVLLRGQPLWSNKTPAILSLLFQPL